jgi:2-polyprenyl-3-methyl-5-hydroxy-6-metoxy-1,4-benzoquinol methylase
MRNPLYFFRYLSEKLPINFEDLIFKELLNAAKVNNEPLKILDLGAGPGSYWRNKKISDFLLSTKSEVTLFDASEMFNDLVFEKGINITRKLGYLPGDLKLIPDNEFDLVIAIDLIEHLTKSQGYLLLYEIDRISKGSTALMTPNGFAWQPPAENNPYNAHLSGWNMTELRHLGWKVCRGQIGLKQLYGPYAIQKYQGNSKLILEGIAILKIVTYLFPKASFSIFVTKKKKNYRLKTQQ